MHLKMLEEILQKERGEIRQKGNTMGMIDVSNKPIVHRLAEAAGKIFLSSKTIEEINPHLSSEYALVLPAAAVVNLKLIVTHQATLSIDGHINLPASDGATIRVKRSVHRTHFLRIHPETSFYGTLERKLRGKR